MSFPTALAAISPPSSTWSRSLADFKFTLDDGDAATSRLQDDHERVFVRSGIVLGLYARVAVASAAATITAVAALCARPPGTAAGVPVLSTIGAASASGWVRGVRADTAREATGCVKSISHRVKWLRTLFKR